MRKLIFNLHLYTALIAGVVVLILGVTGSIMAFESDLDRIFNPALFKVQPASVRPGSQQLSIPALENAVKRAYPSQKIALATVARGAWRDYRRCGWIYCDLAGYLRSVLMVAAEARQGEIRWVVGTGLIRSAQRRRALLCRVFAHVGTNGHPRPL